jgi:SAM-dependent methyltransferase
MKISIILAHLIFGIRKFQHKKIKKFAHNIKDKNILELGSGKKVDGKYFYSMKRFFHSSNKFTMSDIDPKFGHQIIDITEFKKQREYDIILCLNVLEHIYDYNTALDNIYNALKPEGIAVFMIPGYYPLHDEPYDYWRFTEHALRKMLYKFDIIIENCGIRKYPIAYFMLARKLKPVHTSD